MLRLIEVIQGLSPFSIKAGELHVGPPQTIPGANNTLVYLQGTLSSGVYADRAFRYNRYDLSALLVREIPYTGEETVAQLLTAINVKPLHTYRLQTALGVVDRQGSLLLEDVVNDPLPAVGTGQAVEFQIRASAGSYMYVGGLRIRLMG